MIARDVRKNEFTWGLFDAEELKDEHDTACASRNFEEMELRELNMMRLPCCVMALTVCARVTRETVLVFVCQTIRNLFLPSDHILCAFQILKALGIRMAPVLRELAENCTKYLNFVIGIFDENHVFPEDVVMEENELLVAMHFTVAAPAASDWIDSCFHRREVMTRRNCSHQRW